MLGSRTKQVNSYGRRSSRIVNAAARRDQSESVESSEAPSDADSPRPPRPLRRENAIIISPAKHRAALHGHKGSTRSQRASLLTQNRNLQPKATHNAATKPTLGPNTRIRQPLTPLRFNGASSNNPSSGIKSKSKTSTIKSTRASLKPHTPVVTVDIIVLDDEGNMLTQERRLSHTEIQPNPSRAVTARGKTSLRSPIVISDDSDVEVTLPKPPPKQCNRRFRPIVISSDESDGADKGTAHNKKPLPLAKSRSKSELSRVEVVIPPPPFRNSKVAHKPLKPLHHSPLFPGPPAPPPRSSNPATLPPPFPIPKPRQLTPIRGSSSRTVFRRPPPTPSTPTEADLSLDLAQLDLSDFIEIDNLEEAKQPDYLVPLLNECAQTTPYEFSAFIETFPFDPIVQSSPEDEDVTFRKIGEASYSEVFGIGDVVLKVIPLRFEDEPTRPEPDEMPASSDPKDVLKEIIVTRGVGGICDKFVKLLKTYVVKGRYPSLLLDLWDEYNERKGSESIRPESFGLTQVYAIIILPNGGPDLESYAFNNASKSGWHQACGIFWQVARALEQAEQLVNFEHRDLHWGQILVKAVPTKKPRSKCPVSHICMDDDRFGVKVTIIDLGLSRMNATDAQDSKSYWTPFDDEIFEGEGDYQYVVYRLMRDHIGNAWKSYYPFTNVMWLHYLATKLLREKRLKLPGGKKQSVETRAMSPTGYDEQDCYDCLTEMEKLLGGCIASARSGQNARRRTVGPTSRPKSAGDVIAYGIRQGWVQ